MPFDVCLCSRAIAFQQTLHHSLRKNRNTVQALLLPRLARRANIFHFILRKGYRNLIAFVLIKHPLGLFIERSS